MLGPVNVGTMAHNRNEKTSAAETKGETRINIKFIVKHKNDTVLQIPI